MSDLEKMPGKKKWTDRQKEYNISSKALAHTIGANIGLLVCLTLPIILIGFIWTDFGTIKIDFSFIMEGIVTVFLLIIGELLMMRIGTSGGKLDSEYTATKTDNDALLKSVHEIGTMLLAVFCEWQIDLEMKQAIAVRLRHLHIRRKDWDTILEMPDSEIIDKYGLKKGRKLCKLKELEPIELNEDILLFNGNDSLARGGVPISGEDYIEKKSHSAGFILSSIFAGLLSVSIVLTLTDDITFARIMFTAVKLVVLLSRMATGYAIGAKAYNTVEVRRLSTKNNYLRQYLQFIKNKTYLKIGDEYGDISYYIDTPTAEETTN